LARTKYLGFLVAIPILVAMSLLVFYCAYVRLGTAVIGDFLSPDEKWDALVLVRNGGAMTGYATQISIVEGGNRFARQFALFRASPVFVVDDNDGAVRWGDRGQLDLRLDWTSSTQLVVTYPEKARVFRQEPAFRSVKIRYSPSR
jgi:hypothetical protein